MKILLTSGGTRTPIDSVRFVTNMSTGTFGKHLCTAFLRAGHDVTFLYAKGSKCPHELRLDLRYSTPTEIEDVVASFSKVSPKSYHPIEYADFNDYAAKLAELLKASPEIVVLAAAVSDYAPVAQNGKISSELDDMPIRMIRTPKLIKTIKKTLPKCFLVGFKLLVNSTQDQLEDAMEEQRHKAQTDMVVGNDLRDIKNSSHKLTTLSIDNIFREIGPGAGEILAEILAEDIVRDAETLLGEYKPFGA